jgi:hypothetical protein
VWIIGWWLSPVREQSVDVAKAAWIAGRLSPFQAGVVTSVVPGGFGAYARVLYPLDQPVDGQQPGRWADVGAWSGVELVPVLLVGRLGVCHLRRWPAG